jgi:hypothetical protein
MAATERYFAVGAGKVEITPPLEIPYLSFAPRHQAFASVHDPLFVRSVVISDGKKRVAVIAAEAIGFTNSVLGQGRNFTDEVRAAVRLRTRIPENAIMLTAAHVHSSPDTIDIRPLRESPGAVAWLEELIDKIARSVEIADKNMFEARLKLGRTDLPGYSRNRRGENCLDNTVTVLVFAAPDQTRQIILVNYACHPVIVQAQDQVSADYVGVMTSCLEKSVTGLEACLFLQGACGDVNPWVDDTRAFVDMNRMGTALAEKVKEMLTPISASGCPSEPILLDHASEFLKLPSRPLPSPEAARVLETAENRLWLGGELEIRRREGEKPFAAELQVMRLGSALLFGIPGEPFCRMGKSIREIAAPFTGIPVGYANGYLGYIVPPESWEKGGYEVDPGPWSKVGPESHAILLEAIARLKARIQHERSNVSIH